MEKRLVTRCATNSRAADDENQIGVDGVFKEVERSGPGDVSSIVWRLADESFRHLSFHNHRDDEINPISSTEAFAHFQDGHESRREGGVDQQTATLVGSYITEIDEESNFEWRVRTPSAARDEGHLRAFTAL